jgi:hypothetical protein
MRRLLSALFVGGAASLLMAGPASAHTQTVTPPGQGDAIHDARPIARPWIQGHCHAQAPAVSGAASGGVVIFSPQEALPCPGTVTNPGGQVTGP